MKFLLLILLFTTRIALLGQTPKTEAEIIVDKLRKSGVDTVVYYRSQHIGAIIPDLSKDTCEENENESFFWQYKGQIYCQRFGTCNGSHYETRSLRSPPTLIQSSNLFKLLKDHYKEMEREQIVPGVFKWTKKGVEVYEEIHIDHPIVFQLKVYVGHDMLTRDFYNTSLMDSVYGIKNLNFTYNSSTWLNLLKEEIEHNMKVLDIKMRNQ